MDRFRLLSIMVLLPWMSMAQLQTIPIHGQVSDAEGNPVAGAQIRLFFLGKILAQTVADSNGNYKFEQGYYGQVRQVDMTIKAQGYTDKRQDRLPIDTVDFDIRLKKDPDKNVIRIEATRNVHTLCYTREDSGWHGYWYHCPYGSFYTKPDVARAFYHPKMHHHIQIQNGQGQAVPKAQLSIRFNGEKEYHGLSNEMGNIEFFIEFNWAAHKGNIAVKADGYRTKHISNKTFDAMNNLVILLKKRKKGNG